MYAMHTTFGFCCNQMFAILIFALNQRIQIVFLTFTFAQDQTMVFKGQSGVWLNFFSVCQLVCKFFLTGQNIIWQTQCVYHFSVCQKFVTGILCLKTGVVIFKCISFRGLQKGLHSDTYAKLGYCTTCLSLLMMMVVRSCY